MNFPKKLKSIPLKFLLYEWLRTRNLDIIEESQLSSEEKLNLEKLNFLKKEGGFFFGDLKEIKLYYIITHKENSFSENQIQDFLIELKNFLTNCGRKEEDVIFIKYPFSNLELQFIKNSKILFLIVAKSEKPFFESLLGGEIKKNIKTFLNQKNSIKEAIDIFYSRNKNQIEKIPILSIKKIYKKNNIDKIYNFYIKKFLDDKKYVIFIVGFEKENYDINYFKNLIDFYVYNERPVLKLEESLKNQNLSTKVSLILLELRFDFYWKGIFYNSTSIFIKKNKIHVLPEYSTKRKYIKLASCLETDCWILIPDKRNIFKKKEQLNHDINNIIQNFDLNLYYFLSFRNFQSQEFILKNSITNFNVT